jgi:hypothetical protein
LRKNQKKRMSKSYRTFLFKKRLIEIVWLMLRREDPSKCYFCGKPFKESDFPIDGRDKVDIHHVTYSPEYKVLAHHKCHLAHHKKMREEKAGRISDKALHVAV